MEESRTLIGRRAVRLLALLMLLLLAILANNSHWIPSTVPVRAQGSTNTFVQVTPRSIQDLQGKNPNPSFSVNASSSPSINGFIVILYYNTTVLGSPSVDTSGSVLGPNLHTQILCIDNRPQPGSEHGCLSTDNRGVITVSLYLLGGSTGNITDSSLFSVSFHAIGTGLGQVHIFSANLTHPTDKGPVNVPLSTEDGYYTNLDCPAGSGTACKPPLISIAVSPPEPALGAVASFNPTVTLRNSGAVVVTYKWDWGDGTVPIYQYANFTQPEQHQFTYSFGLGECALAGICPVTLVVSDSEGVSWQTTIIVNIVHLFIQLTVDDIHVDPQYNVVPGTTVHIRATIKNLSTIGEDATMAITVEGASPALNATSFSLGSRGAIGTLNATWNTAGLIPRAYGITVIISKPISTNPINGKFITCENNTLTNTCEKIIPSNTRTTYVILITPLVTGALSLGLLQTTGLGILIVIALAVGLARFRKKPGYESEPL